MSIKVERSLPYQDARECLGLRQVDVARALGIAVATVKRIERGAVPYPSYSRLLYDLFLGFQSVEQLRADAGVGA